VRVLYLLAGYPNFSETYMHEEMRAVMRDHEIRIVTYDVSKRPRREPFPYEVVPYRDVCPVYGRFSEVNLRFDRPAQEEFLDRLGGIVEEFRPDVLHGHYLGVVAFLDQLARRHGIPFTVRTHSQDMLDEPPEKIAALCAIASSPLCLAVLTFPAFQRRLTDAGLAPEKVVPCWPVINHARFDKPDPRPSTAGVLCVGPATLKKAHKKFVDLAATMAGSGKRFTLYAKGPSLDGTRRHNERRGNPVDITYADPDDMGDVYPGYDWLVYPGDPTRPKIGFPVSIAEAQASGLGVCWQEMPGRREEQLDYLGAAGFLFESIDEVPAIISRRYPEEMRRRGLENARKCDIERHRHLLIDAWDAARSQLSS
jgi:hypothetical protein